MANKEDKIMFEMREVGKKITEGRRAKGMTQMALADALGISYQAVSSWENGRTMPDISKLPEISELLGISVDEILGKEAPAVQAALANDKEVTLSPEDIAEAAPILPDERVEEMVEKQMEPGLQEVDFSAIQSLLPFLKGKNCDRILWYLYERGDFEHLYAALPFADRDTIGEVFLRMVAAGQDAKPLIVYASNAVRNEGFHIAIQNENWEMAKSFAAFVDHAVIGKEMLDVEKSGNGDKLPLYPFLQRSDMDPIAWERYRREGVDGLAKMRVFLSRDTIVEIAKDSVVRHGLSSIVPLRAFIPTDALTQILSSALEQN